MERIPVIPDFKPGVLSLKALVLENLIALYAEHEEENLYRQHPTRHEPIFLGQPTSRTNQSLADCRSWLSSSLMGKENVPLVPSAATLFTYRSASGMIIE
jgi:hypothetical protein